MPHTQDFRTHSKKNPREIRVSLKKDPRLSASSKESA
jgi:hypothetical protein